MCISSKNHSLFQRHPKKKKKKKKLVMYTSQNPQKRSYMPICPVYFFNTMPRIPPSTPLTLFGFSRAQVNTTAVLAANINFSRHCFSRGYRRGTNVANARGATNRAMSFLLPAVSIKTLHPQRQHPVPTQMPSSIRWRFGISLPRTRGPRRVRARHTP